LRLKTAIGRVEGWSLINQRRSFDATFRPSKITITA
jgi:hypothetical protein